MSIRKKSILAALPGHVRKANLSSILQLMRQSETFSKAELSRASGISTTTVAKLFRLLTAAGLIEPCGLDRELFGRPRHLYQLSASRVGILAAVIDIRETSVAMFSLNGKINANSRSVLPTGSRLGDFYSRLAAAMRTALEKDGRKCLSAAVCLPGLVDRDSGKSVFCPNIHWLENTAPGKELTRRLKLPVDALHEEKALILAHQPFHENHGENFAIIDFSSGVGAGIICDGAILSGHSGFAGEIGHITVDVNGALCGCGNRGCLETVASDLVFYQTMKEAGRAAAMEQSLTYQAIGIAAAINLFNPHTLYVHTRLLNEIPDYLEQLRDRVQRRTLAPAFAKCLLKAANPGKLQGAAFHAIDLALQHRP